MLHRLNTLWRRATLQWSTAHEVWMARPRIEVDRTALREEVEERAERIHRRLEQQNVRGKPADLAERLAIEQALRRRGFLRLEGIRC